MSVTTSPASLSVQSAVPTDADRVVEVIACAFAMDPTWSWAFPDPIARLHWWRFCVAGALRYPWVLRTAGFEAVSIWIPPEGTEFAPEAEETIPHVLADLVASRAPDVAELLRRFEESHPRHEPHYYLSLLGVGHGHRGQGLGMALLRENLDRIDAEGMPAYLESSNPRNNPRYESLGFAPVVSFRAPGDGPIVSGMWRARIDARISGPAQFAQEPSKST